MALAYFCNISVLQRERPRENLGQKNQRIILVYSFSHFPLTFVLHFLFLLFCCCSKWPNREISIPSLSALPGAFLERPLCLSTGSPLPVSHARYYVEKQLERPRHFTEDSLDPETLSRASELLNQAMCYQAVRTSGGAGQSLKASLRPVLLCSIRMALAALTSDSPKQGLQLWAATSGRQSQPDPECLPPHLGSWVWKEA